MGNPLSMEAERGRAPQRQPLVTRDELLDVLEVISSLGDLRHLRIKEVLVTKTGK